MNLKSLPALFKKKDADASDKKFWYTMLFASVVTGIMGIVIGLQQSLWFDDDYSVELATRSVSQLIHLTSIDVHPPAYYLLLKGWGQLFGWGDLAMRMPSILFTMAALATGGLLIRKMFGNRIAIGSMLLVMIAPLLTRYGFEVRMYSMASFICIAATYALYSAWMTRGTTQRRWLISYAVLVVLGLYTLYATALIWITHLVWLLYMTRQNRKNLKDLLPYVTTYAVVTVAFLPWLPIFMAQLTNGALGPIMEPLKLDQIVGIFSFNTVFGPAYQINVLLTAVMMAVFAVYVWAIPRALKRLKAKRGELMLLALYMAVPVVIMMIVSLAKAMYVERYFAHIALGLVLLGAVILVAAVDSVKKKRWVHYIPYVIVYGALFIGVGNLVYRGNYSYQHQYRPAARDVAKAIGSCPVGDRIILTDTPYTAAEIWFYMKDCPIHFVSKYDEQRGGDAPMSKSPYQVKKTDDLTAKEVIYVSYDDPKDALPASYQKAHDQTYGAMRITEYKRVSE